MDSTFLVPQTFFEIHPSLDNPIIPSFLEAVAIPNTDRYYVSVPSNEVFSSVVAIADKNTSDECQFNVWCTATSDGNLTTAIDISIVRDSPNSKWHFASQG